MDPLTATNAFATVVHLLAIYKQEFKNTNDTYHKKFLDWLDYHRHAEIKNLICNTSATQAELVTVLRQDTSVILSKLDSINATLAPLFSQADGFKGLPKAILP